MSKVYNCIDCGHADLSNTNWRGYVKCSKLGIFVDPNSSACYRSCERPGSSSSGCYITTMVCGVLGYDDDCEQLTTLRNFRDNYMKNDPSLIPLLMEYDMVGPLISSSINASPKKEEIARTAMDNYINPAVSSIKAQDYNQAIEIYTAMTRCLEEYFGVTPISIDATSFDYKSINLNNLGKARVRY